MKKKAASSIYEFMSYKPAIQALVENAQRLGQKVTYGFLAKEIGVQSPYLSRVLNGDANLNSDQMHGICRFFELSDEEEDYLLLLMEYERSGIASRREALKKKIQALQKEKSEISEAFESVTPDFETHFDEYFLNFYMHFIHLAMEVPAYAKNPDLFRAQLGIGKDYFAKVLGDLEKNGFIVFKNDRFKTQKNEWHLPKKNPLYRLYTNQARTMANQRMATLPLDQFESYNVFFTADDEAYAYIRKKLLELLKDVQQKVIKSAEKEVYQFGYDLLPWTKAED
jgi:uncharacterized protein (TIGR02147 family)